MKYEVEMKLTPAQLAEAWTEMDDEEQAQFFIECARIMAKWPRSPMMQLFSVGKHLRECACSTPEARDMVTEIAGAITYEG